MKLKQRIVVRNIAGDFIAVPVKAGKNSFEGVLNTNEVGAFLLEQLKNEITFEELVQSLASEFEVDISTAKKDVTDFVAKLLQSGLIDSTGGTL